MEFNKRSMNFSGFSDKTIVGRAMRLPVRLILPGISLPILQGPLRERNGYLDLATTDVGLGVTNIKTEDIFGSDKHGDCVYDLGANQLALVQTNEILAMRE
jgi:hypothetical protein